MVAGDSLPVSPPPRRHRTRPTRRTADAGELPSVRFLVGGIAHPEAHAIRSHPIRRGIAANSAPGDGDYRQLNHHTDPARRTILAPILINPSPWLAGAGFGHDRFAVGL